MVRGNSPARLRSPFEARRAWPCVSAIMLVQLSALHIEAIPRARNRYAPMAAPAAGTSQTMGAFGELPKPAMNQGPKIQSKKKPRAANHSPTTRALPRPAASSAPPTKPDTEKVPRLFAGLENLSQSHQNKSNGVPV